MIFSPCLTIFCILIISSSVQSSPKAELQEAQNLLKLTLKALQSTLDFFSKEYKNVNLDAVVGTRMVADQLDVLLHHVEFDEEAYPLDRQTVEKIRNLQTQAEDISDKAIPYVDNTDPQYYKRIGQLIQRDFWNLDFASKDFTNNDLFNAWLPAPGESIHESDSDNCLTELFGTGPYTNEKCHISSKCWELMTRPGYSGYSLTHQVFYLQIGYRMGCGEEMNQQRTFHNQAPPGDMLDQLCASVYLEASSIAEAGYPENRRDLFMEQAVLCGIMGYRWFFAPEWLEKILSWQDPETGCFKGSTVLESDVEFRSVTSPGRVKREERPLSDGCLCHMTTVAAGALSNYVRYIVEFQQMVFRRTQARGNEK